MIDAEALIVDSFAGGGGASTGIEMALGRSPDYAINHDAEALSMHAANHPSTAHLSRNIWHVDPLDVIGKRRVGLAWFSPDCKHHSKAKGGKPVARNIRDLAWIVVLWAQRARPDVIFLENVEEFQDWCPLVERDGQLYPDASRRGETFRDWVKALRKLGYRVEWRELRACDYGAPTIRKRLFIIARRDGEPIVWPSPTHGPAGSGLLPWPTAASHVIDWSIPCPSIFLTREEGRAIGVNRPLVEATMRRIARGVKRYVIDAKTPFIVPVTRRGHDRVNPVDEPLRTVTTSRGGEHALVAPTLVRTAHGDVDKNGKRRGRGEHSVEEPLPTVTASRDVAVVAPHLQAYYGPGEGGQDRSAPVDEPVRTIVTENRHALIVPAIVGCGGRAAQSRPRGGDEPLATVTAKADACLTAAVVTRFSENSVGHDPGEPLHTVMAGAPRHGLVSAFLAQHNGGVVGRPVEEPLSTITTRGTQQAVVEASFLSHAYTSNTNGGQGDPRLPIKTVLTAGHASEVRAFLTKYYGADQDPRLEEPLHTVTTRDRFGLVTVDGVLYEIVDIGMRMLTPRELFRAQGFPDSYIIERGHDGRILTKTAQIRMCGNSVCPQVAEAIVRANFGLPSRYAMPAAA